MKAALADAVKAVLVAKETGNGMTQALENLEQAYRLEDPTWNATDEVRRRFRREKSFKEPSIHD